MTGTELTQLFIITANSLKNQKDMYILVQPNINSYGLIGYHDSKHSYYGK